MSLTKRLLEERWERGWDSIGKSICPECLTSPSLRALAGENLEEGECDYCGRESERLAVDTDVVMTWIGESFRTEYRDPVHELPYDSGEGGYQGDWFHTYELVEKLGEEIGCDEFVEDMIAAPCPHCGAAGKWWIVEEPYQLETVVYDCACGSHAEVVDETGYLAVAYRQLVVSCPVFVPPSPRRRVWENAQ